MAATAPASAAAMTGNCGRRCRLTVVRRMWVEDLQARYLDDPEAGPCPLLNQGQSWLIDGPVEAGISPPSLFKHSAAPGKAGKSECRLCFVTKKEHERA